MATRYASTVQRPALGALPGSFLASMLRRRAYENQLRRSVSTPGWAIPMEDDQKYVAVGK